MGTPQISVEATCIDFRQRERGWGKSVVEVLSKELQKEFPGTRGFTARNLWFMRQFYLEYSNIAPMVRELMGVNLKTMVSVIDNAEKIYGK